MIVTAAVGWSEAGTSGADEGPTQGSSYAQALQITPHDGALAVGAVFGEALAGHTGTFARAQSQGVDLGSVGVSMRGDNCGAAPNPTVYNAVPQPLEVESGAAGAAGGESQAPSQSDYGANEYALANSNPYGEADTTYAGPYADPTGALAVSGLKTKSWSGLINGSTEAAATSDVSSLSLGAGTVVLNGLDWSADYPTGTSAKPTGTFTIGQVLIHGVPLPTSESLSAVQTAVNQALATLGLVVNLPQATVQQGTEIVSPLELDVVGNATRDTLPDTALNAAQPDYYQIASGLENGFASDQPPFSTVGGGAEATPPGQQLETALCQSDTPITVMDVTLAAFDGGGYFSAAIGGVNASSSPQAANSFDLGSGGFGSFTLPGQSQFIPGSSGLSTAASPISPSLPGSTGGSTASASTSPSTSAPATSAQSIASEPTAFKAGGPLLGAGLGGLGLLLLLIEGDRRMMRRAQRRIISQ
jgi:hypothetical protein